MKHEIEFYGSVTLGDRGQIVIPAEAREEMGLYSGNKLLAFKAPHGGLLIVKPDEFEKHVEKMSRHVAKLQDQLRHGTKDLDGDGFGD